jgi:hypothetical protein
LSAFTMGAPGAKENLACFPAIPAAEHDQALLALNRPRTTEYW